VPLPPAVIVIHDALLAAVHGHVPADAVTFTVFVVVAAAGSDALDDDNENVHVCVPPGRLMYASSNQKKSFSVFYRQNLGSSLFQI
jgi:hypothetical protein